MTLPFTDSHWIWSTDPGDARFAVRRFRGKFTVSKEQTVRAHVSADSRYILYFDGQLIGRGPAKSDLRHYSYETYELQLPAGEHLFAAVVITYQGAACPISEMHEQGAFLLEASDSTGKVVTTTGIGDTWRVFKDSAYSTATIPWLDGYYGIGGTEVVDGARIPHGWEQIDYDDSSWEHPVSVVQAYHRERIGDMADPGGRWRLLERDIPFLLEEPDRFTKDLSATIPSGTHWEHIVQAPEYSIGYPLLSVAGGAGATVRLTYAEARTIGGKKGIRDNPEGDVTGITDLYRPGGGSELYSPLHWRAFRFLKITVDTTDSPLQIVSFSFNRTGYPWHRKSEFHVASEPTELQSILDIDFRTLSCCTAETFMDCPYYEQLQYIGDSRLQALVSYVTTGDTRLGARAVRQFDWSRLPEGLTQARYPSRMDQVIPTFSLIWVFMVEDLLRFSPQDKTTVTNCLPGCRSVLGWFERQLNSDGLLGGNLPWWNFIDWKDEWYAGIPNPMQDGEPSASVNLIFLAALQTYSRLSNAVGDPVEAQRIDALATALSASILKTFWDSEVKLMSEGPSAKWGYSQHAQAWGLLTETVPGDSIDAVVEHMHNNEKLIPATYYHLFYIVEALAKVGRLEALWDKWLTPWRNALALHVSTWPECPEPTRSDCHAWSAWPTYALLTHVLGYTPDSANLSPKKVKGWTDVNGKVATTTGVANVSVTWNGAEPEWAIRPE